MQSELLHVSRLSTMGEMASALAHELNQPLSAMTNYLRGSKRLLEEFPGDRAASARNALDKAAEQSLRAGQVIRRLRDFVSRGETERQIESLKKLVEEASALALVASREQSIRVDVRLDPSVDLVLVDNCKFNKFSSTCCEIRLKRCNPRKGARSPSPRRRRRKTWSP